MSNHSQIDINAFRHAQRDESEEDQFEISNDEDFNDDFVDDE